MSENQDELSDNELDALLADLESRADSGAGGGGKAASSEDDEDLEAFLSQLDEQEPSADGAASKTKSAERDADLDARFAELDNLQPDDLPARPEESKPAKKKKSKKKKKASEAADKDKQPREGEQGPSWGARLAKASAKLFLMALPVILLTWVLGAFLANWISAGWLIAVVALIFSLGAPALVRHFVKKGKFAWWAAGTGLLLTVALTAPMPQQAAQSLSRYGHWPATTVAEIAGWAHNNGLVQLNSGMARFAGGLLSSGPGELPGPSELGTEHSLYRTQQPTRVDTPEQPAPPTNGGEASPNIPK